MLIVHHLGMSQSERVVWLLEELELPYKLVRHTRDPLFSPESLKSVPGNITGRAPFIEDTDANITLSESGAICEYIVHRYGQDRLSLPPTDPNYHEYLRFLHFANATLHPAMSVAMFVSAAEPNPESPILKVVDARMHTALSTIDERLKDNKYLAGPELTTADILTMYSFSTQRYFTPQIPVAGYKNILRWLQDCGNRPAYLRAMEKADPEMKPLLTAESPSIGMMAAGGPKNSGHWKKQLEGAMGTSGADLQ